MRKMIIILFLLALNVFSQEILRPNKNYSFPDTMIVFTEKEFDKLDSLLKGFPEIKKQNNLLSEKIKIMDGIDIKQKEQIFSLEKQDTLNKVKIDLLMEREDLYNKKVEVYKGLYQDIEKELEKKNKKTKFFSNTFWFGTGTVIGVATVFICSVILNNIDNTP